MLSHKVLFLLTLWSLWFFNYSARTIFPPILPIIEQELMTSHAGTGGIFGFISLGYAIGLLFAGPLMRRLSSRRILLLEHGGIILVLALFYFGQTYLYFTILCLILGFAAGAYLPSAIPLLTERFPPRHWAKVIGIHGIAPSISLLIVPVIAAFLLQVVSWRTILLLFSLVGILPLLALVRLAKAPPDSTVHSKMNYSSLFRDKRIWVLGILQGVAAGANLGIYAVIPLFLVTERGFTLPGANQLLGMSRIGGMVVPLIVGAIADRFGYIRTLITVTFLSGVFTLLMTLSTGELFLAIFLFLQTSIIVGFFPLSFALTSRIAGQENRGPAVALVTLFGAISMALTPWLLGTIADHYSFSYGIWAIGFAAMLAPLLLWTFR